ncbi:MAG TPA: NUDIX hydrolase [Candidatus Saccharimonadales bacterium]|nr:NUDIX hydrolase [Candidatus Saccharimonadales bacterium]
MGEAFSPPENYYRVSVKALVFDGQRRLLVFRAPDGWEMPGGGLEHAEDYEAGVRRELMEEVGAEVASVGAELFSYRCSTRTGKPKISIVVPVVLAGRLDELTPRGDDLQEVRFVTKDEFLQLPFQPGEGEVQAFAGQIWSPPAQRISSPYYRVTTRAIVQDDTGNVLVALDTTGMYQLPGGGWEFGEGLEDCLRREIREELGVEANEVGQLWFAYRGWNPHGHWNLRLAMPVKLASTTFRPRQEDDIASARFVTKDEFVRLPWAQDEAPVLDHIDKIWPPVEKTA